MDRILSFALGVALFASFAPQCPAQDSTPPHQHISSSPVTVIDGAVHPELIPDSLAYRLYFSAVSMPRNPSSEQQTHQRAHMTRTGLDANDRETLTIILGDFRSRYDALVAQYNETAKAALAHNEIADVHSLLKKLDELVQTTRDALSVRLSSRGAIQLHSFVLSEKKNMKAQPED